MEISCEQMDMLIAFYIEDDLSGSLKEEVENHIKTCPACKAKYNMISSLFADLHESIFLDNQIKSHDDNVYITEHHKSFRNNLSAYVDNELTPDENIKIKKYAISNKKARQELEDIYHIRKLMSESFKKTKAAANKDFSKNILKNLEPEDTHDLSFSPLIKVGFAFILTVLVISAVVIFTLSI